MRTHTSRWHATQGAAVDGKIYRLRARVQDGGNVLAVIVKSINEGYGWRLGESDTGTFNWAPTRYIAQRRARKALAWHDDERACCDEAKELT